MAEELSYFRYGHPHGWMVGGSTHESCPHCLEVHGTYQPIITVLEGLISGLQVQLYIWLISTMSPPSGGDAASALHA